MIVPTTCQGLNKIDIWALLEAEVWPILQFTLMGLLGGSTYVLFSARERADLFSFGAYRRYGLGIAMGCLYHFLHSDWNFPNAASSFIYGLGATFIIENIIDRIRRGEIAAPSP